ncbi:DUF899 family protein [Streptomyces griseosporeus]
MTDVHKPRVVSRQEWLAAIDALRVQEKAHIREGDATAATRRRLPMTEVNSSAPLIGGKGHVSLTDVFEGRTQLFIPHYMWHDGHTAADQCEGCTFFTRQVRTLSHLHQRGVSFAVFCQGPTGNPTATTAASRAGTRPGTPCPPSRTSGSSPAATSG